jgi:hypothetical protein
MSCEPPAPGSMSNKRARCDAIDFRVQLQEGSGRVELERSRSTPLTADQRPRVLSEEQPAPAEEQIDEQAAPVEEQIEEPAEHEPAEHEPVEHEVAEHEPAGHEPAAEPPLRIVVEDAQDAQRLLDSPPARRFELVIGKLTWFKVRDIIAAIHSGLHPAPQPERVVGHAVPGTGRQAGECLHDGQLRPRALWRALTLPVGGEGRCACACGARAELSGVRVRAAGFLYSKTKPPVLSRAAEPFFRSPPTTREHAAPPNPQPGWQRGAATCESLNTRGRPVHEYGNAANPAGTSTLSACRVSRGLRGDISPGTTSPVLP